MPAELKPIKRVWHPRLPAALSVRPKIDLYDNHLPEPDVQERNTDSIWDTFDALQAADAQRLAMRARIGG